jgi:signal peptidase
MNLKETSSTVIYILIGVLLAFGINQGMSIALATEIPIVAVESHSMKPTFFKGDILVLQGQDSYQLKDIIVFARPGNNIPVVHRIIDINSDGTYQTKGDANLQQLPFEKSIKHDDIFGKVILIIPYLGWIKIGITDYVIPNTLWIIILAILIYAAYMVFEKLIKG